MTLKTTPNAGDRETRMYISEQELNHATVPPPPALASGKRLLGKVGESHVEPHSPPTKIKKKEHKSNVAKATPEDISKDAKGAGLPVQEGMPWDRYRELVSVLDLGDKVLVASERTMPMRRVGVRRFPQGQKAENVLSWIRKLRHPNIVAALEVFSTDKILYVVFEEMHISLDYLVRSPWKRTSDEVGVILGQVRSPNPCCANSYQV